MPWIGGLIAGGAGLLGASMQADAAGEASQAQAQATREANAIQQKQYDQTRSDLAPYRGYGNASINALMERLGIVGTPGGGGGYAQQEARDSIRNRLLPQFTTTKYDAGLFSDPLARAALSAQGITQDNNSSVDESALNSAIEAELARQAPPVQQQQSAEQGPSVVGSLLKPFTAADVATEPGYAFGMQQGQQALDRKAQAGGGYFSGAALKAASRFGNDYGSQKYGDAFNRDAATKTQQYNFLSGGASLGQNAAAQTGNAGSNMANQVGANTTAMGNALGASSIAQGNAYSGALNNGANAYNQNALMDRILGGNKGFGGGSAFSQSYGRAMNDTYNPTYG